MRAAFVFAFTADGPMPNAGGVPKFLRWGQNRAAQRLWCSIMRLLASNRVRGEFGRTGAMSLLLRRHLQAHATRASHHTRPVPLIQACFFATSFRRMVSARRHSQGGDCGSDSFLAEPEFPHRLDAAGPILFGRLRYPVVNSKRFCGGRCPRGPCGRCLACRDRIQQCWCLRYIGVSSGCFGPPSLGIGNHFARRNQASK